MSILIGFLYVVEVVVCLLLALVVMLQKPKEGGLGGLAGGMGEAVFGANAGNVLVKVTVWLSVVFLANTLVIARVTSMSRSASDMGPDESAPLPVQQESSVPAALPSVPAAPASTPAALPAAPAKPAVPAAPAKPAAPAPAPAAK